VSGKGIFYKNQGLQPPTPFLSSIAIAAFVIRIPSVLGSSTGIEQPQFPHVKNTILQKCYLK